MAAIRTRRPSRSVGWSRRIAAALPVAGDVLDVGNGLAAQDRVIADVARPRSLTAVNITWSQLDAGRDTCGTRAPVPCARTRAGSRSPTAPSTG